MNMHKRLRLTPLDRQKIWRLHQGQLDNHDACALSKHIMETWHKKHIFDSKQERQIALARFINFYNTVKPHAAINNIT